MMASRFWVIPALLFSFCVHAQSSFRRYSELGPTGGMSYYMGELNPGTPFFMALPGGGLVFRHSSSDRWTWRVQALYLQIQASDAESKVASQELRNLSFRSAVWEFSPILEFNFFPYEVGNSTTPATPYVFGGFALFRYNPKTEFMGKDVELQPLGTEGQGTAAYADRKMYNLTSVSLPFGMGVKFHAFGRLGVSIEWGLRKTFTDYLDDVSTTYADPDVLYATHGVQSALLADRSLIQPGEYNVDRQRGNPSNKDWYSFAGITLSYKLMKKRRPCATYQ